MNVICNNQIRHGVSVVAVDEKNKDKMVGVAVNTIKVRLFPVL